MLAQESWILPWWVAGCAGNVMDVTWAFGDFHPGTNAFIYFKDELQLNFRARLLLTIDATFLYSINHDVEGAVDFEWGKRRVSHQLISAKSHTDYILDLQGVGRHAHTSEGHGTPY
jgi:hypothetical protein